MGSERMGKGKFKRLRVKTVAKQVEERAQIEHLKRIEDVEYAYDFIERRELTDKKVVDDVGNLAGIYSAQMVKYSRPAEPDLNGEDWEENERAMLRLPEDGGIFNSGIPFHHYTLKSLKDKHIRRLKENGVEINKRKFSSQEDRLILENWKTFAEHNHIDLDLASLYVSAATATEEGEERRERLRFCHSHRFRPWMCKRLLDRTCVQVFRRCYVLFHCANQGLEDTRPWTREDDSILVDMVKTRGNVWEIIGSELSRTRFSCQKRYTKLEGSELDAVDGPWEPMEIAKFYRYLCDNMSRHPVLVATIPNYEHYEDQVQWDGEGLDQLKRSIRQRQEKWGELKAQFRGVKEMLKTDFVKEVERAVIPDHVRVLSKAKSGRILLPISAEQLAKCIDVCLEQEGVFTRVRQFDQEELMNRLHSLNFMKFPEEIKKPARRIIDRIAYLVYVCQFMGLFQVLPVEEDVLKAHLQILSIVLKQEGKFRIKKRVVRKHIRRFIRANGWSPRKQIIYVDTKAKE